VTKAAKIALLACVAVLLAGGGAFYWFVLRDDAPPEAALRDRSAEEPADTSAGTGSEDGAGTESTDGSGAADSADGTWVVLADDPEQVFVGYRVLELFAGESIQKEAAGRTPTVEGSFTLDASRWTAPR
jgi:hypothetical protein